MTTFTIAEGYALTRHIVLALDIGFQTINATHSSWTAGVGVQGEPAVVGKGYSNLLSIAPAMGYLFTQHVGLIAGPWFSLRGKNTSEFFGVVAALHLFLLSLSYSNALRFPSNLASLFRESTPLRLCSPA